MSYWFFGAWEKQNFVHQVNFVLFEIFKFELLEFAVPGHKEIQKSEGFAEGGIHVIFYTIVRPAREMLGNSRPSIAKKVMELNKRFFIFLCPKVIFGDRRVELIKPSKKHSFYKYLYRHCFPDRLEPVWWMFNFNAIKFQWRVWARICSLFSSKSWMRS